MCQSHRYRCSATPIAWCKHGRAAAQHPFWDNIAQNQRSWAGLSSLAFIPSTTCEKDTWDVAVASWEKGAAELRCHHLLWVHVCGWKQGESFPFHTACKSVLQAGRGGEGAQLFPLPPSSSTQFVAYLMSGLVISRTWFLRNFISQLTTDRVSLQGLS